jgi:hypothetical protein
MNVNTFVALGWHEVSIGRSWRPSSRPTTPFGKLTPPVTGVWHPRADRRVRFVRGASFPLGLAFGAQLTAIWPAIAQHGVPWPSVENALCRSG